MGTSDGKLTPDELAMHLSDIAKEHGAALTEIEFLTHTGTATGTHRYSAIRVQRIDSPLPHTVLCETD